MRQLMMRKMMTFIIIVTSAHINLWIGKNYENTKLTV